MKRQTLYRIIPIAVLGLTMQSCFVAKKYETPQVIDEQFYRTDKITQDTTSIGQVAWKEFFNDQYLLQYIDQALENNIDIRIALENINAAQAYMKQGKWGYAPTLNLGANYSHSVSSKNTTQGRSMGDTRLKTDLWDGTAQFSWELDVWGKIRSNQKATAAGYLQSVAAHQAVKTQLISTLAQTYYELLALDQQKIVTQNTIVNREKSLETMVALKDAGQVTEVAVKQSQAQLYNAQVLLLDLENSIKLTENYFSLLLGKAPEAIQRGSLENQNMDTDLSIGVPTQLLANRPDVRAAELGFRQAFEFTNVSRSNFYPSFRITANGGLQSTKFDDFFSTSSMFANILGGLTQPLLNGRAVKTQYQVSKAVQEQAYLDYKNSMLIASKEVSDALFTYQSATKKAVLKKLEYESYNDATDFSEELLIQGMATYLDVLTARESALAAQLSYINLELTQLNSLVALYRALGGGVN
ncbi:efflux transporter outer membrane subunit [Myroides sp. LJL116]